MSVASNWTYHCKQYDFFYSLIQNHINTSIGYMYTYIHTYVYIYARARAHTHTQTHIFIKFEARDIIITYIHLRAYN